MEEERVKEDIGNLLLGKCLACPYDDCLASECTKHLCRYEIDQILAIKGIRIESDDQSLPETPMFDNCQLANVCCIPLQAKYQQAQQDMKDVGFVKCIRREDGS